MIIKICIVLSLFLVSCSDKVSHKSQKFKGDGITVSNYLVSATSPVQLVLNEHADKSTPVGKYESFLLNSSTDLETRLAFQDYVYASQNSNLFISNTQVSALENDVQNFTEQSRLYQRPNFDKIEIIQKKYQTTLRVHEEYYGSQKAALEAFDHAGTGVSIGIGASGAGLPLAISTELAKNFIVNRLEAANEEYFKNIKNQAIGVMVKQIDSLSEFDRKSFDSIDYSNPDSAYKEALNLTDKISLQLMPPGLDQETRSQVQASVSEYLAKSAISLLAEHKSIQGIKDSQQDQHIKNNSENLVKLTTGFIEFQKETGKQIGVLLENQKEIVTFVDEEISKVRSELYVMNNGLQKVTMINQFMADYLYSKMSTQEQIQALEKGVYGDPSSKEVQDLLQEKETLLKKEEFQQDIKTVLNYANSIAIIGERVGLDPKISQEIISGIDKTQKINAAFEAFANSNYIGAALALTGVFGKGGIDPAAERHSQMMKVLQQMDMKLDKVISLQQQTIEMISQVSKQIQESTILLSRLSYENKYILLGINETLQGILNKDFNSCIAIKKIIEEDYNNKAGYFFLKLTHSNLRKLEFCSDLMESRFYANNSSAHFHFSTYITNQDAFEAAFPEKQILGLIDILNLYRASSDFEKYMNALLSPSAKFANLTEKLSKETSIKMAYKFEMYERKLNPRAVLEHVRYLIDLLPLITIYQNLGTDLDILSAADSHLGKKQFVLLQSALIWTNRAIAQETLLFGDALIPLIANSLNDMKVIEKCDLSNLDKLYCALNTNESLLKNVVYYLIFEDLRKQNRNITDYATAVSSSEFSSQFSAISKVLTHKWEFVPNENGFVAGVKIAGKIVALPTSKQLRDGRFEVSPILSNLIFIRDRMLVKMTEMEMNSNLSEEERRYLAYKVIPQL